MISTELDDELTFSKRAVLWLHLLVCALCRRYRRQAHIVDEAVQEFVSSCEGELHDVQLSHASKERMKCALDHCLDADA